MEWRAVFEIKVFKRKLRRCDKINRYKPRKHKRVELTVAVLEKEPLFFEGFNPTKYLHADQLGSIIAITNKSGTLVEQYAYSAFGEMRIFDGSGVEIQNSQVGNIFGFTGREFDSESHLYYYRARYYDPSLGRFISADPIGFGGGDANLYRYVFNNALILKDPTGLSSYVGDMLDYLEDLRVRGLCKLKGKKCNGNDPIDMDDVPSDPDELERMMDDSNDSNESDESAKSCPLRRKNRA